MYIILCYRRILVLIASQLTFTIKSFNCPADLLQVHCLKIKSNRLIYHNFFLAILFSFIYLPSLDVFVFWRVDAAGRQRSPNKLLTGEKTTSGLDTLDAFKSMARHVKVHGQQIKDCAKPLTSLMLALLSTNIHIFSINITYVFAFKVSILYCRLRARYNTPRTQRCLPIYSSFR